MPYDPRQPRIPRDHEGGGRFTADHNWVPLTPQVDDPRVILARGPAAPTATLVRPAPPTLRPASPTQPTTPGSLLPGTSSFPQPAMPGPIYPWMPGSPQRATPDPDLPWAPSDPFLPSAPRHPFQAADHLSRQVDWYAALSAGNSDKKRVVLELGREFFRANPEDPIAFVRTLNHRQVGEICKQLGEVQQVTDRAFRRAMAYGKWYPPSHFGTAVHWEAKDEIEYTPRLNKALLAEISFIKTLVESGQLPLPRAPNGVALYPSVKYGTRGSIRIDVLESADAETVCVYDIKTGRSTLSLARSWELAGTIFRKFPTAKWIFVTEVRPGQSRRP
jgi:hypothetical protein